MKRCLWILGVFWLSVPLMAQTSFHDYTGDDHTWGNFTPGWNPGPLHMGPAVAAGYAEWATGYLAGFAVCNYPYPFKSVGFGVAIYNNCGWVGGPFAIGIGDGDLQWHAEYGWSIEAHLAQYNLWNGKIQDEALVYNNCDVELVAGTNRTRVIIVEWIRNDCFGGPLDLSSGDDGPPPLP